MRILLLLLLPFFTYAQDTAITIKSGRWTDKAVWKAKKVPGNQVIKVVHVLTLDTSVTVSGILVEKGATLTPAAKNITLQSSGNIIVKGKLAIKSNYKDTIRFIEIDESRYQGGGMSVMDSDVGLWVRGTGILDFQGTVKTSWTNLAGLARKGDKSISLWKSPVSWKIGDEIVIAPTDSFPDHFEVRKVIKITGGLIGLDSALKYHHPATLNPFTNKYLTAEVGNLTRNIVIEGGHVNIMTSVPSTFLRVKIVNAGIKQKDSTGYYVPVNGRYPLHFHHSMDGGYGARVEDVIIAHSTRAFVPHASHGIKFKRCIAFDILDSPYWWDVPLNNGTDPINNSNDITFDSCISIQTIFDPSFRGYRLSSFFLGSGTGNTIKNCIAISNQGNSGAAGFLWPESSNMTDNLWIFENNKAHNNKTDGIFTWQNDKNPHLIKGFIAYNNLNAIEHGAYLNNYTYQDCDLINNKYGIFLHANPMDSLNFKNVRSNNPIYITSHTAPAKTDVLFTNCIFPKVIVNELRKTATPSPGLFDFIKCNLKPENFEILRKEEGTVIKIDGIPIF